MSAALAHGWPSVDAAGRPLHQRAGRNVLHAARLVLRFFPPLVVVEGAPDPAHVHPCRTSTDGDSMKTSTLTLLALSLLAAACGGSGPTAPKDNPVVTNPCLWDYTIAATDPKCVKSVVASVYLLQPSATAPNFTAVKFTATDTIDILACKTNGAKVPFTNGQIVGWQRMVDASGYSVQMVNRLAWRTADTTIAAMYAGNPPSGYADAANIIFINGHKAGFTMLTAILDGAATSYQLVLRVLAGVSC